MSKKLVVEIDLDKYSYVPGCGIDIPLKIGQVGYCAHLLLACSEAFSEHIVNDLKKEATDG